MEPHMKSMWSRLLDIKKFSQFFYGNFLPNFFCVFMEKCIKKLYRHKRMLFMCLKITAMTEIYSR